MLFDPENKVVQLCAQGMSLEGQGKPEAAEVVFQEVWRVASTDFEKFTAAHYVARHQPDTVDKLAWDEVALQLALTIDNDAVKATLPSLYLNVGKDHEELKDFLMAKSKYKLANSFAHFLPNDGYGTMIRAGIKTGLERIKAKLS